jgi:hypothetical protein
VEFGDLDCMNVDPVEPVILIQAGRVLPNRRPRGVGDGAATSLSSSPLSGAAL